MIIYRLWPLPLLFSGALTFFVHITTVKIAIYDDFFGWAVIAVLFLMVVEYTTTQLMHICKIVRT